MSEHKGWRNGQLSCCPSLFGHVDWKNKELRVYSGPPPPLSEEAWNQRLEYAASLPEKPLFHYNYVRCSTPAVSRLFRDECCDWVVAADCPQQHSDQECDCLAIYETKWMAKFQDGTAACMTRFCHQKHWRTLPATSLEVATDLGFTPPATAYVLPDSGKDNAEQHFCFAAVTRETK